MAYGKKGMPGAIPPNSWLEFDIVRACARRAARRRPALRGVRAKGAATLHASADACCARAAPQELVGVQG
jgi:hypothetical protein